MGISCKKPSRANTSRTIDFVANFLVHVQLDMNVVLKDPSVLPDLNLKLQENPASLVRRYEYDAGYRNVKVYLSSYKLRRQFGSPSEAIWRKLFVRLNKGGWSAVKRQAYDSCWVLNADAERRFLFAKQHYMDAVGIKPHQLLRALQDFDEKLVAPAGYGIVEDEEDGFRRVQGFDKRVMSRNRHRAVLLDSQCIRADVREHNLRLLIESVASEKLELDMQSWEPAQC